MAGKKIKKKQDEIIKVHNLVKYFPVTGGIIRHTINQCKAVDGVSFTINKGVVEKQPLVTQCSV